MSVSLKKIDTMAGLSFKNGLNIHFDSIILFNQKSYATSYFLSVIALEEFGKSFLLADFLWHSQIDGRMSSDAEEMWVKAIYHHRYKQNAFSINIDMPIPKKKFFKDLLSGMIEKNKQNALYVGLPRLNKKLNLDGRIINPTTFSKNKTMHQITKLNDALLELILGVIKDVYTIDSSAVEKMINRHLYNKVKKTWPIAAKTTISSLQRIEQVV